MEERKKPLPHITIQNSPPPYDEKDGDYVYFVDGGGQPCAGRIPFRPDARDFELVNAWWLCEAATLAYSAPEQATPIFEHKTPLNQVVFLSTGGGSECFVASNNDFAIVAFRGSELTPRPGHPRDLSEIVKDWLRNAQIRMIDFDGGGKVHRGFYDGVNDLWGQLTQHLASLPGRRVWFTGHSLGAALATVAAARMLHENRRLDGLYTFGSPRVGDEEFAKSFDRMMRDKGLTYYRFVNGQDVVTTVPVTSPPLEVIRYKHAGTLKHIDRSGHITDNPTKFEQLKEMVHNLLPIDASGHLDPLFFDGIPNAIDDHIPTLYSTHIWNALV